MEAPARQFVFFFVEACRGMGVLRQACLAAIAQRCAPSGSFPVRGARGWAEVLESGAQRPGFSSVVRASGSFRLPGLGWVLLGRMVGCLGGAGLASCLCSDPRRLRHPAPFISLRRYRAVLCFAPCPAPAFCSFSGSLSSSGPAFVVPLVGALGWG
jgi:hypothetical protein